MKKKYIGVHILTKKCPVCGKEFHPEVEHAWRTGIDGKKGKPVCTYTCMRKWEKENHIKRRGDER